MTFSANRRIDRSTRSGGRPPKFIQHNTSPTPASSASPIRDARVQNGRSAGQAVQPGLRRGLERPVFAELHSYDVTRGFVPAGGLVGLVAVDRNPAEIRSAAVQCRQHVEQHVPDRGVAVLRLIQKADYAA